ncbi:flavodoxin [Clostridium algifaecis]|uniref:Flavodoxin n=1 Tax=Clostridium algifaecis TaxID=1472040 RepID=A0ABS4KPC5_9CLOT|nr:hypothetical protein [Clostridium algifaecis]MBP2031888.1 flavodoxin [Clostridium algifaecis]
MKTLIIYESIHHGNTERIGKKLAEILNADMVKANWYYVKKKYKLK